jgi:DDE superfamily endonuclease
MTLLTGTLLAHGRRTVAGALRHTGNESETNFSTFHQVLNRARWSPLAVSRQVLTIIVETFVQAGGTLELVIDETLERRWGPKINKRGHYRDSALSSRKRSVSSPGLRGTRHGRGCHASLDQTTLGLALVVRAGHDPGGERDLGQTPPNGRPVGAANGEGGASLVPQAADHAIRGYGLQHPGTGPALSAAASDPHHPLSSGCSPA